MSRRKRVNAVDEAHARRLCLQGRGPVYLDGVEYEFQLVPDGQSGDRVLQDLRDAQASVPVEDQVERVLGPRRSTTVREQWYEDHRVTRVVRGLAWTASRPARVLAYNLAVAGWLAAGAPGLRPRFPGPPPVDHEDCAPARTARVLSERLIEGEISQLPYTSVGYSYEEPLTLSNHDRDVFIEALENPPQPSDALRVAKKRHESDAVKDLMFEDET